MMDDRSETARRRPAGPGGEPARYDRDLYSWAVEQAELLRAGRIAEADARNIAEELDDVGNEQYDKLQSALRIILLHLLKWDHQPRRRSRGWWASITVQRNHVRRVLRKNPGLKPHVNEAVGEAYEDARVQAAVQTHLNQRAFPARCPFSWHDIMEREISWPAES
jgi:Domain of unknown function DUF29